MKENDIEEGFWVFVSHSTKDFERVCLVRNALEDSGFRPILFYLKCLENENEVNGLLKREIDARKRFILCDSPNAQASKFVQSEVEYIRSKNRMYEIIDLSKIDIDSQNAEKEVLELIKPFRRRTSVFLCYASEDKNIAKLVCDYLILQGFNVNDISLFDTQEWYRYFGNLEKWTEAIRQQVVSTLSDGYFLYLIGSSQSYFIQEEFYYAFEYAPKMILPVIINSLGYDKKPTVLNDKYFVDVSKTVSDEEKAKAIVNALINFDLRNNNISVPLKWDKFKY